MKKTIIILLAAMLMISSVSLAEDLSSLPDADLLVMYRQVSIELESRGIDPKAVYPEDAFPGDDLWNKDMADRLELFFGFWNASDIPGMLTVCSPGWKDGKENPDADLLTILGNRTATDFDINAVSRGPSDYIRIVSLTAGIDKSDGNDPANYVLQISMTREADGLWYVDPGSLQTFEYTADDSYAASASEAEGDSVSVGGDMDDLPNIIPAKGIEDFLGEWHYFRIVNEDGSEMNRQEMLAEGIIGDHAEFIITKDEIKLYAASLNDSATIGYEFVPDDGSLRILNGGDELPVLRLADNGMLVMFVPAYNTTSGDTTAYLTREVP